ncbi:hypothetical protein PHMEG_000524 [Phytophthora megakarya]|uniref:Reverse transcriptase domain-containing protein n=1 Tax=Phytophthora megakarya TaxID=4795 RepID=A0A225X3G7_9STRA|nr:hypothetical protein PHMEG_000524 [Phytophthora megakarya]
MIKVPPSLLGTLLKLSYSCFQKKLLQSTSKKKLYSEPRYPGTSPDEAVTDALRERVQEVTIMGAPHLPSTLMGWNCFWTGCTKHFALELGNDPSVDMPPMEIKLKPDAKPVQCRARRYSQEHQKFPDRHVKHLLDLGLCYKNPSRRLCPPSLIINKPGIGNFRMTVNVRGQTRWRNLQHGQCRFSQWNLIKICSILTEEGMITPPTRVLMGGTNSVDHVQSTVQAMFTDIYNNGLFIWIDDLLGYSDTAKELLKLLRKVLTIFMKRGLKLNPRKCHFSYVKRKCAAE